MGKHISLYQRTEILDQGQVLTISVRAPQNFQAWALGDFHDRVSSTARAWGHKFSSEAIEYACLHGRK